MYFFCSNRSYTSVNLSQRNIGLHTLQYVIVSRTNPINLYFRRYHAINKNMYVMKSSFTSETVVSYTSLGTHYVRKSRTSCGVVLWILANYSNYTWQEWQDVFPPTSQAHWDATRGGWRAYRPKPVQRLASYSTRAAHVHVHFRLVNGFHCTEQIRFTAVSPWPRISQYPIDTIFNRQPTVPL